MAMTAITMTANLMNDTFTIAVNILTAPQLPHRDPTTHEASCLPPSSSGPSPLLPCTAELPGVFDGCHYRLGSWGADPEMEISGQVYWACPWGQHLWKGRERRGIGQNESLGFNAISTKVSADPTRTSEG